MELFPLPAAVVEPPALGNLSRGCRQRVGVRRACQQRVADCIDGLNWCAGASGPSWRGASGAQQLVHAHVERCVADMGAPPTDFCKEEAVAALLRSKAGYEVAAPGNTNLAPFVKGQVSLPGDLNDSPELSSILPEPARVKLEGYRDHMLRSPAELLAVVVWAVVPFAVVLLPPRRQSSWG